MLRDGVEDREYLYKLRKLVDDFGKSTNAVEDKGPLTQAQELAVIPSELVNTQFDLLRNVRKLLKYRAAIERLSERRYLGSVRKLIPSRVSTVYVEFTG